MRCIVTGPQTVLGRFAGQIVHLDEEHADRLIRAGHVRPAPEPPPRKQPKRPRQPRPDAGLSHVIETADKAEEPKE